MAEQKVAALVELTDQPALKRKRKGRGQPKKKPKPAAKKAAAKAEQKDTSDYSMIGCQCSAGVRCVNL